MLQGFATNTSQPDDARALARVLVRTVIGERNPDLSQLPAELKGPVQGLLDRLVSA